MTTLTPDQRWAREALALMTPKVAAVARGLGVSEESLRTWRRGTRRPSPAALTALARLMRAQAAKLVRHAARRSAR